MQKLLNYCLRGINVYCMNLLIEQVQLLIFFILITSLNLSITATDLSCLNTWQSILSKCTCAVGKISFTCRREKNNCNSLFCQRLFILRTNNGYANWKDASGKKEFPYMSESSHTWAADVNLSQKLEDVPLVLIDSLKFTTRCYHFDASTTCVLAV